LAGFLESRAAEKQKEKYWGAVGCYKQATPTGFESLGSHGSLSKDRRHGSYSNWLLGGGGGSA